MYIPCQRAMYQYDLLGLRVAKYHDFDEIA